MPRSMAPGFDSGVVRCEHSVLRSAWCGVVVPGAVEKALLPLRYIFPDKYSIRLLDFRTCDGE
jgi:hypothetical protein